MADLAIDLGTANTLVWVEDRGIIYAEPTVIAHNTNTGEVMSVGHDAWKMIGRTPGYIVATRPMRRGAIDDFDATAQMIRLLFKRLGSRGLVKPVAVVAVPSAITEVERRAVEEAVERAGARSAHLIEEPIAAAIGAGLPIHEASGNFVIDIGGGTSEIAVISLGGVVVSKSIRVAGFDLDAAVTTYIRKQYNLAIGEGTAEAVKIAIGSAWPQDPEPRAEIRGRDLQKGLPRTIVVSSEEIRGALEEPLGMIVEAVKDALGECPPELATDILRRGIHLTGGSGLLNGLGQRLESETGVPVHVADRALETVVIGAGQSLVEMKKHAELFLPKHKRRRPWHV